MLSRVRPAPATHKGTLANTFTGQRALLITRILADSALESARDFRFGQSSIARLLVPVLCLFVERISA